MAMLINHAILGILSCKSLTGYDLKKIIQDSPFMYWSGNNNQIYKALVELHNEGFVTNEVYHQDSSPSKKVYTITAGGLEELKRLSLSAPEAPEIKKTFLIQLAWAQQLENHELESLLSQYEQTVRYLLLLEQGKRHKGYFMPDRTPRETAVWNLIYDDIADFYTRELNWISLIRDTIGKFDGADDKSKSETIISTREDEKMNYRLVEKNNQKYILLDIIGEPIQSEQDGLELVSICMENDVNRILIQGERLSDDFLRLRTGVAGAVLQKFTLYSIKAVAVLDKDRGKGKFNEFLYESNRGNTFRAYTTFEEAENWLLENG